VIVLNVVGYFSRGRAVDVVWEVSTEEEKGQTKSLPKQSVPQLLSLVFKMPSSVCYKFPRCKELWFH